MRLRILRLLPVAAAFLLAPSARALAAEELKGKVVVLRAATLTKPFDEIAAAFMKLHPGVKVEQESAGSLANARKVTELKETADVFASADIEVIDQLLMPAHADWYVSFARNEMVIAYTDRSKYASELTARNWWKLLLEKKDAQWGYPNPDTDPEGYNTVLLWKLAERYYKEPGLAARIKAAIPKANVRDHSVAVQGLLEAGELDYDFQYLSTARQHKLRFLRLPDELNLGSLSQRELYKSVEVKLAGSSPGQLTMKKGLPIVYGLTVLKEAPNPRAALEFVKFVLGPEGRRLVKENYQGLIDPPEASDLGRAPESLKALVSGAGGR
jgi:molybdate/tungstate transport system substrate-binding protein